MLTDKKKKKEKKKCKEANSMWEISATPYPKMT